MRWKNQGRVQINSDPSVYVLRDAIVLQASREYRQYLKAVQRAEKAINEAISEKNYEKFRKNYILWWYYDATPTLNFFKSAWFTQLTDIAPDYIIKKLREETPCGK